MHPDDRDPMAERRRNSAAHYDAVDDAIAAQPKAPTYIATTSRLEDADGVGARTVIRYDDGHDTTITVAAQGLGRVRLEVASAGDTAAAEFDLHVAQVLDRVLRDVAGMTLDKAAPITGSR